MEHILRKEVSGMAQGLAIDEYERRVVAIMRGDREAWVILETLKP